MLSLKAMEPYVELLAERYLSDEIKISFDAFLILVSESCPSVRHLESFLKSNESIEDLQKAKQKKFFATWQEASVIAVSAGIDSVQEYKDRREKTDDKLPGNPAMAYKNFPGWNEFLGRYSTWQKASTVAFEAGIDTFGEYRERYKDIDQRLPSMPHMCYQDWPGWDTILGQPS